MQNIWEDNKEQIGIIAGASILAFAINYFLFELSLLLSCIYDVMLILILSSYFYYKNEFGTTYEKVSVALMSESVILSFKEYNYSTIVWFFFPKNVTVTIAPNMLTIIISILFFISLWIRNGIEPSKEPINIIMLLLGILFLASLISVLISNEYYFIPFIGETNFTSQSICVFLLILSWVGIRCINLILIPIVAFLSLGRIVQVDKAMRFVGVFYLLFACAAIILQIVKNEKMTQKFKTIFGNYSENFKKEFSTKEDNKDNNNYNSYTKME